MKFRVANHVTALRPGESAAHAHNGLAATFGRAARTRRGIAGIAVGIAGCALAISTAFIGQQARAVNAASSPALPHAVVARLDAIAASYARQAGGRTPQWVTAVATTHGRALQSATPGDSEATGAGGPVYLITMKGDFTDYGAPRPAGAAAPTGHYLSVVVSAQNFAVLDWGLSAAAPAVSPATLGPLQYLTR
jgi:hypothetical protein